MLGTSVKQQQQPASTAAACISCYLHRHQVGTYNTMPATPMLLARMPHVGVPYLLQGLRRIIEKPEKKHVYGM